MLDYGADLHATDQYNGRTPFLLSVEYSQFNTMLYLVRAGANLYDKDQYGYNALHILCEQWETSDSMLQFLIDQNLNLIDDQLGLTVLFCTVMECSKDDFVDVAHTLLKAGVNINARGHSGNTALMLAIQCSEYGLEEYLGVDLVQLIKDLIEYGADLSLENEVGETALDIARNLGYEEAGTLLTSYMKKKQEPEEFHFNLPTPIGNLDVRVTEGKAKEDEINIIGLDLYVLGIGPENALPEQEKAIYETSCVRAQIKKEDGKNLLSLLVIPENIKEDQGVMEKKDDYYFLTIQDKAFIKKGRFLYFKLKFKFHELLFDKEPEKNDLYRRMLKEADQFRTYFSPNADGGLDRGTWYGGAPK